MVVLLLKSMESLKQLYSLSMDVHSKFRSDNNFDHDVEPRFNERFILSLTHCDHCLVLDDEMNNLPICDNKAGRNSYKNFQHGSAAGEGGEDGEDMGLKDNDDSLKALSAGSLAIVAEKSKQQVELEGLKADMKEAQPLGAILDRTVTLDQAHAVMQFVDVISEKNLRQTVSLTAGRGRGKSASLGLALGSAIAYGYSNIFVTAPSPQNLQTVFEFLLQAFDALKYQKKF
eukprot:gene184-179_t